MKRWLCSRPQVLNSRSVWKPVSGAPSLGRMVHWKEVGLGFQYARCAGSRGNESWQDLYLSVSSNDMQNADWGSSNGVTADDVVWEYTWRVCSSGSERLSRDYRWRTGVASVTETAFYSPPPIRLPVNYPAGASNTYIGLLTDPGGDNAQSCSEIHKFHQQADIWNRFETH